MKKLIGIFFIGVLLSVNTVNAQNHQRNNGGQGNAERMQEMSNKAKVELGLSSEQEGKWDAVHQDFMKEMMDLREDDSISSEDRSQKMQTLNKQKNEAIEAILTKDQMKKLQEMRMEMRESRSGGKKGGNKWGTLKEDLNLNDDQSKQWDEIVNGHRSEIQSIRNDDSIDEETKRNKMRELKGEMTAQIMAILNSEQQVTFKKEESEMKQMRKQNRDGNGTGRSERSLNE